MMLVRFVVSVGIGLIVSSVVCSAGELTEEDYRAVNEANALSDAMTDAYRRAHQALDVRGGYVEERRNNGRSWYVRGLAHRSQIEILDALVLSDHLVKTDLTHDTAAEADYVRVGMAAEFTEEGAAILDTRRQVRGHLLKIVFAFLLAVGLALTIWTLVRSGPQARVADAGHGD